MPSTVHQLHCGRAGGGRQGQARVSKIMETQIISADSRSCPLPGDLQDVGREGHSSDSHEDEAVRTGTCEAIQMIVYLGDESVRDRNCAPTSLRFRFLYQRLSVHRHCAALLDAYRRIGQIDVPSSESKQFCSSKLTPGGERDNQSQMLGHRSLEGTYFGNRGHGPFCGTFDSRSVDLARRGDKKSVNHRGSQYCRQEAVCLRRRRRMTLSEVGVPTSNCRWSEIDQRRSTQSGKYVKFEQIVVEFASAEGEFVPLLEPTFGVLVECRLARLRVDPRAAVKVRINCRQVHECVRFGFECSSGMNLAVVKIQRLPASRSSLPHSSKMSLRRYSIARGSIGDGCTFCTSAQRSRHLPRNSARSPYLGPPSPVSAFIFEARFLARASSLSPRWNLWKSSASWVARGSS
jgi:hypothetical protein